MSTTRGEGVERLRRIDALFGGDLGHLNLEDLLNTLVERVRAVLDVDTSAVLLLEHSGGELVATAARGIDEEVQQGVRVPLGVGFAGRVAAGKRAVVLDDVTPANVHNPLLVRRGIRSLLGVPLLVGGDVLGVLHVGTLTPRCFTDDDVNLLQLVADRVALALQAQISQAERTAAARLQRSLLPPALPSIPGLQLAARYVPGEGQVGGDWYDVFPLPSGQVCIVVGDVAGRGLPAAVTMGRLRTVFRAYALDGEEPAGLLTRVDQYIRYYEPTTLATALCAVLDPRHQRMLISTAGHPPPMLAEPGRDTALVDLPHDLLLGVDATLPRHVTHLELSVGAAVCFYTDGLVERRDTDIDTGLDRLRRAMPTQGAETVAATIMAELVGRDQTHDDVALLVLTRLE
ncbi:MAG: SpoIIE family protein phosphatase [Pseudonocardia sp.]|uniref:PP2C family protein-serine/threonine phosphatase n=1 Tax=Pseudonocardia sp. TaxID=60912 RepID=UPI001ACD16DD|nr:GAF domain-containing SpoIIE family protein phosphatase [Pseudonocardia sp.]MBN9099294.1 SpoIIE family protein phosphatase [Pseudonocardia sp.]